ncbi:flavin reductase [Komagataeibacter nataicola]|uniref:Flavin reductase n=4 Tax=Acetobacteraceae TaxID=433 RepID=A0A939HQP1_9PROT|nr:MULTISPECIES: flavin reductase family protein [Acetobacteraceae]AQU88546.1 flavin reductase [Komagataeibacter nataicola]KXV58795.1 flavin reductase [Acetobacter senegalensis]MBO1326699.1 flavin reductase [Acetobacter garciniae]MBX0346452.1 flavin reductase family protein [Acetobacter garciniae]MCG4256712.1 flavin reductase family protein [Acetobacter senegalensis]
MDEQIRKTVLRMIPYGLYVLTGGSQDSTIASATINWVTQTSFVPPLLALGIKTDSAIYAEASKSGDLVLNILGREQGNLAFAFFKPVPYADGRLGDYEVRWAANGAPILACVPAAVELKVRQIVELGDHHTFVCEVTGVYLTKDIAGRPDDAILHMKDLGEKVFYGG